MAEINIWTPDSRMDQKREQPPRIYRGVDKKEWKYWMGICFLKGLVGWGGEKDYYIRTIKNYILPPFSKGLCNL